MTSDDVKNWLDTIGKDRAWLADQLRAKKGSVDQWFSRGFPQWAQQIIRLLRVSTDNEDALKLQFSFEEWQLIQRAMARAGYTSHFTFFKDAILAFAEQEVYNRKQIVPLNKEESRLHVAESPGSYKDPKAPA